MMRGSWVIARIAWDLAVFGLHGRALHLSRDYRWLHGFRGGRVALLVVFFGLNCAVLGSLALLGLMLRSREISAA